METEEKVNTILCCVCSAVIEPNGANMCAHCLSEKADITEGLSRQEVLRFCTKCGRYNRPPWVELEPESKELLAMCLKRIKGMNRVKLIDAGFLYTEAHSRRIRVKLTVQGEAYGVILQQSFVVEYIIQYCQCIDCIKDACNQSWSAAVQVRQKVEHKRTFLFLEQMILKHRMQTKCINISSQPDGVDFFFAERSHARSFLEFLKGAVPMNFKDARQLVSTDIHSNVFHYKYCFTVTILPICKDDLLVLPPKLAANLGNIQPLVLCDSVTDILSVVDPFSCQREQISVEKYNRNSFEPLLTLKHTIEFVVIDIQIVQGKDARSYKRGRCLYQLAEATVARHRDFGNNDATYRVMTHLGGLLKPGDIALGYDIEYCTYNDDDARQLKDRLPPVVLLKKVYPRLRLGLQDRPWKLKELEMEEPDSNRKINQARLERDKELVLRDIEEDEEMQSKVQLYKNEDWLKRYRIRSTDSLKQKFKELDFEEDAPIVDLADLLDEVLPSPALPEDEEEKVESAPREIHVRREEKKEEATGGGGGGGGGGGKRKRARMDASYESDADVDESTTVIEREPVLPRGGGAARAEPAVVYRPEDLADL